MNTSAWLLLIVGSLLISAISFLAFRTLTKGYYKQLALLSDTLSSKSGGDAISEMVDRDDDADPE